MKAGTSKVHGTPLGLEDGKHAKEKVYKYKYPEFVVPQEVYEHFQDTFALRGKNLYKQYQLKLQNPFY